MLTEIQLTISHQATEVLVDQRLDLASRCSEKEICVSDDSDKDLDFQSDAELSECEPSDEVHWQDRQQEVYRKASCDKEKLNGLLDDFFCGGGPLINNCIIALCGLTLKDYHRTEEINKAGSALLGGN